jgi:quercetin dioxygenase-like cupin family protein
VIRKPQTVFAGLLLGLSLSAAPALAQEEPLKRTILQQGELSGIDGHEGVLYRIEFAPGAEAPKHAHPGDELLYVASGSIVIQPEGKEAITLKTGESVHMRVGTAHTARNPDATAPAVVIGFMVSAAGQPLATLVE